MSNIDEPILYTIYLRDAFSFCEIRVDKWLNRKQVDSVIRAIDNRIVVFSKLVDGIHWSYYPFEIRLASSSELVHKFNEEDAPWRN